MKKRRKNEKKKLSRSVLIQNVVIGLLLVIFICLCVAVTLIGEQRGNIRYTSYDDKLIQIKAPSDLKVQANIYEEQYIAMLVSTTSSETMMLYANVDFQDSNGSVISTQQNNTILLHDGKTILLFDIPGLAGRDAGNINISVTSEAVVNEVSLDSNKITYQETHEISENNDINFRITGYNQNDSNVYDLIGNVVGLKDGKIVAYASFLQEEVGPQTSFTSNVDFLATLNNKAEIVSVDYDELLIFTSMMSTDPS